MNRFAVSGGFKQLSTAERFNMWAKGLAMLAGGLIAVYGAFLKGEPGAELAYKELAKSVNELRNELNKEREFTRGLLEGLKQAREVAPIPAAISCKEGYAAKEGKCVPATAPKPPQRVSVKVYTKEQVGWLSPSLKQLKRDKVE